MARQIQIRRGTATEHNSFTGAIGEITMDTTNNTLRVHDGQTVGGTILAKQSELIPDDADYVISYQPPTSGNNYTWIRTYKSGWVEQGGIWSGSLYISAGQSERAYVSLPVHMNDTNYTSFVASACDANCVFVNFPNTFRTQLVVSWGVLGTTAQTMSQFRWYVCGVKGND